MDLHVILLTLYDILTKLTSPISKVIYDLQSYVRFNFNEGLVLLFFSIEKIIIS
jgi:hypothetical protein